MTASCLSRAFIAFLISLTSLSVYAQTPGRKDSDRERVLSEIRNYKHDILVKTLDLTKDQQREFFPIYDELEDRLQELNAETRDLEKRVAANEVASETEIAAAAAMVYSQKDREGTLEMEYYDKFKSILTPRQLLGLRGAEKSFTQKLVRHHNRLKDNR